MAVRTNVNIGFEISKASVVASTLATKELKVFRENVTLVTALSIAALF